MTKEKNKSLFGEKTHLEFSRFKLLDEGFGLGTPKAEEKKEEQQRKRDLTLLAKMRTEIQSHIPRGTIKKKSSEKEGEGKLSTPLVDDKQLPLFLDKTSPSPRLENKVLPPPLSNHDFKKKQKKMPIEAVLTQQLKKAPPPKEEILGKEKLEKARKQIEKKSSPSFSFLLLGHTFDLILVTSLLVSEVFLLSLFFKREEIFLLDVILNKFSLSNLSFFSVLEGMSFLYLAFFLYYLLFSLFLGRSLGFFLLLKIRKNTQGKKT